MAINIRRLAVWWRLCTHMSGQAHRGRTLRSPMRWLNQDGHTSKSTPQALIVHLVHTISPWNHMSTSTHQKHSTQIPDENHSIYEGIRLGRTNTPVRTPFCIYTNLGLERHHRISFCFRVLKICGCLWCGGLAYGLQGGWVSVNDMSGSHISGHCGCATEVEMVRRFHIEAD